MNIDSSELDERGSYSRIEPAFELVRTNRPSIRNIVSVRALSGGFTEASVLVCDIDEVGEATDGSLLRGQYIVKISEARADPQSQMHLAFTENLNGFAASHVPPLLLSVADTRMRVDVYGIANYGLRSLRAADEIDFVDLHAVTQRISGELLEAQLQRVSQPDYATSIGAMLRSWLPTLFSPGPRWQALQRVADRLGANTAPLLMHQGEYLPNPAYAWAPDHDLCREEAAALSGPSHGDLHLRNVLVTGAERTKDLAYWIIDINWGEPTPLLYDQAYLEMSVFIEELRHSGARSPLLVLASVDDIPLTSNVIRLPRDQGVVEIVEGIRHDTNGVLERMEMRRRDIWELQYPLARVAAGLNWATKPVQDPVDEDLRAAAFLYAAWTTKVLISRYFPKYWTSLVREHEANRLSPPLTAPRASMVDTSTAQKLLAHFLESNGDEDLYLIADEGFGIEQIRNLAYAPWALIVDFDSLSDENGLSSILGSRIGLRRHIAWAGLNTPDIERDVVIWLHANGWSSRSEPRLDDFNVWRRTYLSAIRHIIDRKAMRTANRAASVLVLQSGRNDRMVRRVYEAIDERYEGNVHLVELPAKASDGRHSAADVLDAIAPTLPITVAPAAVVIPGRRGPVGIPVEDQLWLGEDLEILHSGLLAQAASTKPRDDEFWRGRPPSWVDLAARLDVSRTLQSDLQNDLENALAGSRPVKFELAHSPGAGGTTLARRLAWDLSTRYPTVLLRQYSSGTLGRLEELVKITDRTVLMVAEAAHVSEAELEDLLAGLHRNRVHVVTLWINRTNVTRDSGGPGGRLFLLRDPMQPAEAAEFAEVYEHQAETDAGKEQIRRLGRLDFVAPPAQWLSPFFFGLCAYERRFSGLQEFVRRHVSNLSPARRQVAKYLALATRYGQLGLPVHLLRYWLTEQWSDPMSGRTLDEELRDLLGDDLRHITVIDGSTARLMHPQVAERVLEQLLGGSDPDKWLINLSDASVEFVDQLTGALGPNNLQTLRLLENLFVRRTRADENRGGNFSELISSLPKQSAHRVLERLTATCPNEPHFWNHLGRHLAYEIRAEYSKAEDYLLTAVELSHGEDAVHLHTLGQVRRIAIEQQLRSVLDNNERSVTAEELRDKIGGKFQLAMEAFARARVKSPGSEHSYITPVQLVLHVLERLRRASGYDNLPELIGGDSAVADWVSEQFASAETLLEEYRNVKAGPMGISSRHFRDVERDIEALYGNIDFLMEEWRAQLEDNEERASIGRALARAHVRRARRNWARLEEWELREIEVCLDNAMRSTRPTDSDLRTWFQAYRRLPEYNELRALDRFSSVVQHIDSLEAHYYLYVLHFMRWYRGDEFSQDAIRSHIEKASKLARSANSQWSYEWMGVTPEWCPLAHFSELGEWSGSFWNYVAPLKRVSGVIQDIEGPQFGTIRVGEGRLMARFNPRERFRRARDENALVDFFLGFSYEGLRAWEVDFSGQWKPGKHQLVPPYVPPKTLTPRPTATQTESNKVVDVEPNPQVPVPRPVAPAPPTVPVPIPSSAPDLSAYSDPVDLIDEFIRQQGGELDLLTLGSLLSVHLGVQRYEALRNGRKLKRFLEDLGFHPLQNGAHLLIRPRI
ncbi:P-loop NTPase [Actinoplanes sp. NPDC004185]